MRVRGGERGVRREGEGWRKRGEERGVGGEGEVEGEGKGG